MPQQGRRLTLDMSCCQIMGEMAKKVMVIVPRTAPALFAYLKDKFADDATISVIMDRRIAERRRRSDAPATERRQSDRRQAGRDYAIVVSES
jgi:hypothetical protein